MILLFSALSFASDPWTLLIHFQRKQAQTQEPILVGTTDSETKNAIAFIQRIDPNLRIMAKAMPVIGDVDAEMNRAIVQSDAKCGIYLKIENQEWTFKEHGDCAPTNIPLSIEETEDSWHVLRDEVQLSTLEWAILTKDDDLHELLLAEQRGVLTSQRGLYISSAIMATSSLFPLLGIEPGMGSGTEDRLWTSGFLLSSAAMLYTATKYPAKRVSSSQKEVSNYVSLPYAQATVQSFWPEDGPEVDMETETKDETRSESTDETQSKTKDETQSETKDETQSESETKDETQSETKDETQSETKDETQSEIKDETQSEIKDETQSETKDETQSETKDETKDETEVSPENDSSKTVKDPSKPPEPPSEEESP